MLVDESTKPPDVVPPSQPTEQYWTATGGAAGATAKASPPRQPALRRGQSSDAPGDPESVVDVPVTGIAPGPESRTEILGKGVETTAAQYTVVTIAGVR